MQCLHCGKAFATSCDVAQDAPNSNRDHLCILYTSALSGICNIGRSHDPQARAAELHESMHFYLHIHSVFWGRGSDECKAHQALASFRLENVPGQEWFQLEPKDACAAVARALG